MSPPRQETLHYETQEKVQMEIKIQDILKIIFSLKNNVLIGLI